MESKGALQVEEPPPPRPHTVVPDQVLELDSDVLAAMSEDQLRTFAETHLSLVFPGGTSRGTILTKIVNSSLVIADGP